MISYDDEPTSTNTRHCVASRYFDIRQHVNPLTGEPAADTMLYRWGAFFVFQIKFNIKSPNMYNLMKFTFL